MFGASMVGIFHIPLVEGLDALAEFVRGPLEERLDVGAIEAEEQVEAPEITRRHGAGPQGGEVVAAGGSGADGAGVRWLAHVVAVGPRRVDQEPVREAAGLGAGPEHALGGGGAADVTGTDQEHTEHPRGMAPAAPGCKAPLTR